MGGSDTWKNKCNQRTVQMMENKYEEKGSSSLTTQILSTRRDRVYGQKYTKFSVKKKDDTNDEYELETNENLDDDLSEPTECTVKHVSSNEVCTMDMTTKRGCRPSNSEKIFQITGIGIF